MSLLSIFTVNRSGRDLSIRVFDTSRNGLRNLLGVTPDRVELEARIATKRVRDVAGTRAIFESIYDESKPPMRRLLEESGLTPRDCVLRWGNFDKILLLPGAVFSGDASGRSYRMKPKVKSVWLRNVALPRDLSGFFLVPDTPAMRSLASEVGAFVVPGSEQTTNSWGCRGPEPDLSAPIKGLILGDSNMQGLFVSDDQTPPQCLARELEVRLNGRVSLLNTGHLGYSTEQYARTLEEYGDRFKPDFVLLTMCVNDFGDVGEAMSGGGDWAETRYWLERIYQWCRTRNILCVTSPLPYDHQVISTRREGGYPGHLNDISGASSLNYVFPIEDLVDEFLRIRLEAKRQGRSINANPLYNTHIDDHHFSPLGSQVWGKSLGRRISRLLEWRQLEAQGVKRKVSSAN